MTWRPEKIVWNEGWQPAGGAGEPEGRSDSQQPAAGSSESPQPAAVSSPSVHRHYEGEEFPEKCDHCPRALIEGQAYRRAQLVLDLHPSLVGGTPFAIEGSHELVLCEVCARMLDEWVRAPLESVLPAEAGPEELDDAEEALCRALEREAYVLAHDPEVRPRETPRAAIPPPPDEAAAMLSGHDARARRARERVLLSPPRVPDVAGLDAYGDLGDSDFPEDEH